MPRISEIDPVHAPEAIQKIIADHVADGHALTAEKRTLLHNAAAFNAEHPNQKWVTDISYIQTQEGVLYLSMIRDLYDRSIVAYRTGTSQTINLVLDTIHLAMKSVKTESRRELHLHSDQGFQYTSYYKRVVFLFPSPGVCYNARDAVDWFYHLPHRRFL